MCVCHWHLRCDLLQHSCMSLGSSKFLKNNIRNLERKVLNVDLSPPALVVSLAICSCLQSFAGPVQQFAHFRFTCGNKSNAKKRKPKTLLPKADDA